MNDGSKIVYLERRDGTPLRGIDVRELSETADLQALRTALQRTMDERNTWRDQCHRLSYQLARLLSSMSSDARDA